MKYALVDDAGVVVNCIEYDGVSAYSPPETFEIKLVNDWCVIGESETLSREDARLALLGQFPLAADPAAPVITRRQFLLAADGVLFTGAEAEAAARGEVPAAIEAVFSTLPTSEARAARITWASMTRVERNEPLVAVVAAAWGMTDQQVDEFFLSAASK